MGTAQKSVLATTIVWTINGGLVAGVPGPTVFTFQGQLKDDGVPANGDYDMLFTLYDAHSGGVLKGGPLIFDGEGGNQAPVSVVNGLFQVPLNFGDVFDGAAFWVEAHVRPHATGNYVPLEPRQPITAAPVALYALDGPGATGAWNVAGSHIHNSNAGNVGIGTATPAAQLHVTGDIRTDGPLGVAAYNPNNPSAVAALGWFNDVARIRIGGEGPGAAGGLDIQKTGDRSLMRIHDSGDVWIRGGLDVAGESWFQSGPVGIGTTDPGADLHVWGDGSATTVRITNGGSCGAATNTALRVMDTCGAARAASFYGVTSDEVVSIINDGSGPAAVFGGDVSFTGGNVGIGTNAPAGRLHVTGGTDSAPGGGGHVIIGDTQSINVSIDNNEIMARSHGFTSTLYINNDGGDVQFGGGTVFIPVLVVEREVDVGYEIVLAEENSSYVVAFCPEGKRVISGGCDCGIEIMNGSGPESNGTLRGWFCSCDEPPNGGAESWAICAKIR